MKIVLATNNVDKIKEMKSLLADLPVEILTRDDFENFPDVDETGSTLEENAMIKATAVTAFCDLPALADDSGLNVDALHGAPGVYSSRFAGEDVTYLDNNKKLIEKLQGVAQSKRTARFRCVIAIDWNDGETDLVEGSVEGFITEDIAEGKGFGYDPVFMHPPSGKRFSEMTVEEKNQVSHRGLALLEIKKAIQERLG